jgi:hypothetical protein
MATAGAAGFAASEDSAVRVADLVGSGGAAGPGDNDKGRQPLPIEEAERDPRSEMITVRLLVDPPKRAHVFWGQKDLGTAPIEIQRPRGSGPLDLLLRAPGYLTFHTRAFTDRDDKVTIHLVPESEAPRMFGYRGP